MTLVDRAPFEAPTVPNPVVAAAGEYQLSYPGDTLFAGSLGRAAAMGWAYDPYRPDGEFRDLDIIRFGNRPLGAMTQQDIILDYNFEPWIAADKSALIFPYDPSVSVPIPHPETFAPHYREIDGVKVPTPHPEVLDKINHLKGVPRAQDIKQFKQYREQLAQLDYEPLHPELLAPFDEFQQALRKRTAYQMYGKARLAYHQMVPKSLRYTLHIRRFLPNIRGW